MNRTRTSNLRNSVAAAICTIIFSTTCLMAAAGPVRAASAAETTPRMVMSLA